MYETKPKLSDALRFAAIVSESKVKREQREAEDAQKRAAEKPIAPYLAAAMR